MAGDLLDNPAARLGYWLPKAESEATTVRRIRNGHHENDGRPHMVREAWAQIWELDLHQTDQLLQAYDNGLTLIKEAMNVRRIASASSSPFADLALQHFDQVEDCVAHFARMEQTPLDVMMDPMKEGGWHSLKLLSTLLREESPEPAPDDETRADLLEKTHSLIQDVLDDTELDSLTKTQIVDALAKVQDSLIRFKIGGAPVVEEAADQLCGSLVRSILRRGQAAMAHPSTVAVLSLINAISIAFGMGADYLAISQTFATELDSGR